MSLQQHNFMSLQLGDVSEIGTKCRNAAGYRIEKNYIVTDLQWRKFVSFRDSCI